MRETRKSNNLSQQQVLNDRKVDPLQDAVEDEYTKLYRQTHKAAVKTARHFLRYAIQRPPPRALTFPIPASTIKFNSNYEDHNRTVSVAVSDGANQRTEKISTNATIMPALTSVRELISYVPTMRNLASRGDLTGIPYLGDTFDREDQKLINSISGETNKSNKHLTRKNKLDEQYLEILYQSIRSNPTWNRYTNAQIIDAILYHHRDSTPRMRLIAFANPIDSYQSNTNIDACNTIDMDIDDLIIKSWCSRFCPRCYTYNCLLHQETYAHLPLPKQIPIANEHSSSSSCSSTCYKQERDRSKRSLSPLHHHEHDHCYSSTYLPMENNRKRARISSSSKRVILPPNENHPANLSYPFFETQKKHFLTRIENHMNHHLNTPSIFLANDWTLTDRSLFRLFYILFDGDLCSISYLFDDHRTCQDIYQQFILDTKYFSERISSNNSSSCLIRQSYRRRMLEGATRAFLFHIKKLTNTSKNSKSPQLKPAYQACLHNGPCTPTNKDCFCMKNGTYCEKYCNCSIDCPHRFPGCSCKGACLLNHCLCCAEGRECDPDLCHKCGASLFLNVNNDFNPIVKSEADSSPPMIERKTLPPLSRRNTRPKINENPPTRQHSLRSCRTVELSYKISRSHTKPRNSNPPPTTNPMMTCANISLQRKLYKQILIAESDVAGYGAFLASPIAYPGDLIAEYTGEIISEDEADRRGRLYDKQACSYLFNLDSKRCVDARQFGSKIRFANHSSNPNCVPKVKLVNGDYRIGIYAKQMIFQGEELFFEYMYDAHQRQQFVNNERIDELEQNGLTILKRYGENFLLVRPSDD